MSPLKAPRKPAWPGLKPVQDAFAPVSESIYAQIVPNFGGTGKLLGRELDRPGPAGHYHYFPKQGAPLFLKALPKKALASQLAADKIVRYLSRQGLPANPLLPAPPCFKNEQLVFLACPLIQGRFPSSTKRDLQALGRATANLHNTLVHLPFQQEIQERCEKREQELKQLWFEIRGGRGKKLVIPKEALAILKKTGPNFPGTEKQVIHGDLNPGNILFIQGSDKLIFIDFEDCLHSWLPPIVDLAMLLERCVLVAQPADQAAEELAVLFLEEYKKNNPAKVNGDLGDTLQNLAARALILLALAEQSGNPPTRSEWQKFIQLFYQTRDRQSLLTRLTDFLNRAH